MTRYARGPNDQGHRQALADHCPGVAQIIREIGATLDLPADVVEFSAAYAPFHDIGKAPPPWQHYLLHGGPMVPHAIHGARLLIELADHGVPLAAGYMHLKHHTGMRGAGIDDVLRARYGMSADEERHYREAVAWSTRVLGEPPIVPLFKWTGDYEPYCKFRLSFALLVRADHHNSRDHQRGGVPFPVVDALNLDELALRCDAVREQLAEAARKKGTPADIIAMRSALYGMCAVARVVSGVQVYLVSAPTGAAKTLAFIRLAVALGAVKIIYVSPYLTITDQTQAFLSTTLGQRVMDHTSHTPRIGDPDIDEQIQEDRQHRGDWDHPQINTTTERLSQVLFGSRTMDIRRYLSLFIPGTVVVIDEAHTIPPPKLRAYLRALKHTRCRVVLSSANLDVARAILEEEGIPSAEVAQVKAPRSLRRFEYEPCVVPEGPDPLAKGGHQVLSIYNTIATCCVAFYKYGATNDAAFLYHSEMPVAHRRAVEREVRRRLSEGEPVYLFATQGIEVGIDLDFPRGMRQVGPIQSVMQGAGRVNREGKMAVEGVVTVWYPPKALGAKHFPRSTSYQVAALRFWTAIRNGRRPRNDMEMAALAAELDLQYIEDCRRLRLKHRKDDDRELTDHEVEALMRCRLEGEPWYVEDIARRLTLIDNDPGKVRILVNYKGAADRILDAPEGTASRQDYEDHTIEMWADPSDALIEERDVQFRGSKRSTAILVWTGVYDSRTGLR